MPLRSVRTVRIVKLYETRSQIRCGNILSPHNEMQFTDRIRTVLNPDRYVLLSNRISLSNRKFVCSMQFNNHTIKFKNQIVRKFFRIVSVCLFWTTLVTWYKIHHVGEQATHWDILKVALFWMSQWTACSPAWRILYHVTASCKGPVKD